MNTIPRPEHPRPQFMRDNWINLNGEWDFCFDENENGYVWADNGQGKLEKRPVELGRYDEAADVYEILSGLSEQDYVAVPDDSVCIEGAPTTKTEQGGAK